MAFHNKIVTVATLLGLAYPVLGLAGAGSQSALDTVIEAELHQAYKNLTHPIADLVASALKKATPSPLLDEVDRKVLDFPPQDLTDVSDFVSMRFDGERRIQQATKDAYIAHGGGKAGAFAASQAQGMAALGEVQRQEILALQKAEKRRGVIRFRFDYAQGEWALATEQIAQDPADYILMARAIRRSMEENPARVDDDKREKSVLSYATALIGTAFLPFGRQQQLRIFDETQSWYDAILKSMPQGKKKKLAAHNLAGCMAFLHANLAALDPREGERVAQRLVDSAILAEDVKLYDEAIFSLEHQGGVAVNNRQATMLPDEAFLIAGLYQETKGNKAQALEVYQAYLQDYAGFNLKYKAQARYFDVFSRKVATLAADVGAKAHPHVNKKWGVHADDMQKAAKELDNDKKRKAGGLDWD